MLYKNILPIAEKIANSIKYKTLIAGSIYRKKEIVNDIDIIIILPEIDDLIITKLKNNLSKKYKSEIIGGNRKLYFIYKNIHSINNIRVDLFICTKSEFPFMKLQYCSSVKLNILYRGALKKQGYKLNQYGLFKDDKLIKISMSKLMEMINKYL